jgi:hypothetical protein
MGTLMRANAIYSASDKALFDALNQKKVTNGDLRELFLSRGMLMSKETPRKQLALHFSRLTHDYADYQLLAKLFGGHVRRDKLTSVRVKGNQDLSQYEAALLELKRELEADGTMVKVAKTDANKLEIEFKYQAVFFNKSEFRQVVSRTAKISLEKSADSLIINSPFTEYVQDWVQDILGKVEESSGTDLVLDKIQLPPSTPLTKKNEFFRTLIRSLTGFTLDDVSDVYVSKPKPELPEGDDDDEDEIDTGIHISKASLRGQGVLDSKELRLLAEQGFYLSKIVWTARQHSLDSDIYEFEAQFADADNCADFSYLPRGYYRYLAPGSFNQTRTGFPTDEDQRLGGLIEQAARTALNSVLGAGT